MPQVMKRKRKLARVMVRPPVKPSDGALTVRQMFGDGALLVRKDVVPKQYRAVINWGNSTALQHNAEVKVLNKPEAVATAANKLRCFEALRAAGVRTPQFVTADPDTTKMWFARTILNGSCGEGIVVVRPEDLVVPAAPLYVEYIKKVTEFRLHVVNGNVIFAQAKKKRRDFEHDADEKLVRNYDNGWVFCIAADDVVSQDAKDQAIKAVAAAQLDFGAVDLVIGRDDGLAYVLEINTAPGLASPTLIEAYKAAMVAMVGL